MTDQQLPDRTGDIIDDIVIALTQRGDLSDEHRAFYQSLLDRFDVLAADRDRALRAAREATTEHDGTRRVYSAHDIDVIERAAMASGAASMRERAACEVRNSLPGAAGTLVGDAVRALPLLPDNADTLPAADMVEPGDEVPDLAELYGHVARLDQDQSETTKAITKRLADIEIYLGIGDGDGDEDPAPCLAESPLPTPSGFPYQCEADAGHDGDHYALRGSETWAEDAPCEVCGRAPDEQEHGPDGRCRHTPATRLGHPTTKTGDTK